jgi:hypothetical protein
MKRLGKLSLSKETLWHLDAQQQDVTVVIVGNDSCVQSCFLRSCEGGCTISTGMKD